MQPPIEPGPDATDAERAEWTAAIDIYRATLRRCHQTGDWTTLIIEGQTPTKFVMRPIDGDQWRYLLDEAAREDEHKMGVAMFWHYMFRCSVVAVKNLGTDLPTKPVKDRDHPALGLIAPSDIPNYLDRIDASIVAELGQLAYMKARDLDPL